MKISPLDIRKQEFKKQVRGYDVDEVRSFLTMVAEEYEGLLNRAKEMKNQVDHLRKQVDEYQTSETSMKDSMYDVHQIQQQKAEKVLEEAEYIKQKASFEAERMIHEAKKRHHRLLEEIHRLDGLRKGFLVKMHHILGSQLELVQILEDEDPTKELGVSMKKLAQAAERAKPSRKPTQTAAPNHHQQARPATEQAHEAAEPPAPREPEKPQGGAAKQMASKRFRSASSMPVRNTGASPSRQEQPAPRQTASSGEPTGSDSDWLPKTGGDKKETKKTHFDL